MLKTILINGQTFQVYHAEAGGLKPTNRILLHIPPDADRTNPLMVQLVGSWDRHYLLVGEHCVMEFVTQIKESIISTVQELAKDEMEQFLKKIRGWEDETATDKIRAIDGLPDGGRVEFTTTAWTAISIIERPLTTAEFQVVHNQKMLAMVHQNAVGLDQGQVMASNVDQTKTDAVGLKVPVYFATKNATTDTRQGESMETKAMQRTKTENPTSDHRPWHNEDYTVLQLPWHERGKQNLRVSKMLACVVQVLDTASMKTMTFPQIKKAVAPLLGQRTAIFRLDKMFKHIKAGPIIFGKGKLITLNEGLYQLWPPDGNNPQIAHV
jgi:hypothetical protein